MAIKLYNNDSGAELAEISAEQLQFLIDQLEEETSDDQDYYLQAATLERLEGRGADPALMEILRSAMGDKEGLEIRWQRHD